MVANVHKATEGTGEFTGNKIADKIVKPNRNPRNFKEINISPGKREKIFDELRQVLWKMEQYKISKFINNSSVLKFVSGKWIEVNDLSRSQYSVNKNIKFNPKKTVGGRGEVILTPLRFLENIIFIEIVKPWFFVILNIIITHIFPENVTEILQVVGKIWRFSSSIVFFFSHFTYFWMFPFYKETDDISI